jgi:hypothetical protein
VTDVFDVIVVGAGPAGEHWRGGAPDEQLAAGRLRAAVGLPLSGPGQPGSVDWLCFPRVDGPSVFARILDQDAGPFMVGVAEATATRRYVGQTMALETTFQVRHRDRGAGGCHGDRPQRARP